MSTTRTNQRVVVLKNTTTALTDREVYHKVDELRYTGEILPGVWSWRNPDLTLAEARWRPVMAGHGAPPQLYLPPELRTDELQEESGAATRFAADIVVLVR